MLVYGCCSICEGSVFARLATSAEVVGESATSRELGLFFPNPMEAFGFTTAFGSPAMVAIEEGIEDVEETEDKDADRCRGVCPAKFTASPCAAAMPLARFNATGTVTTHVDNSDAVAGL